MFYKSYGRHFHDDAYENSIAIWALEGNEHRGPLVAKALAREEGEVKATG